MTISGSQLVNFGKSVCIFPLKSEDIDVYNYKGLFVYLFNEIKDTDVNLFVFTTLLQDHGANTHSFFQSLNSFSRPFFGSILIENVSKRFQNNSTSFNFALYLEDYEFIGSFSSGVFEFRFIQHPQINFNSILRFSVIFFKMYGFSCQKYHSSRLFTKH